MTEEMQVLKYSLSLDEHHACIARYQDGGKIRARLWPAIKTGQGRGRRERFLLISRYSSDIGENDRIECERGCFRAIEVKKFPKHTEATLEREDPQA